MIFLRNMSRCVKMYQDVLWLMTCPCLGFYEKYILNVLYKIYLLKTMFYKHVLCKLQNIQTFEIYPSMMELL